MLTKYIEQLRKGQSLSQAESHAATLNLFKEETSEKQITDFLRLLHTKGETTAEILGTAMALHSHMHKVPNTPIALDIVGTGGDGLGSVNLSTGAAILAASCGVTVAKHGNRAVSSQSGSADILEALNINIYMSPEEISNCMQILNIGFCFAPLFHPLLIRIREIRSRLGTPSIFNLVGPLLNPAGAQHYLLGVFSPTLLKPFADLLLALKVKKSAVVHSQGLDEMTCAGHTQIIEVDNGVQTAYEILPSAVGLKLYPLEELLGKKPTYNADLLLQVFSGKQGAITDALLLNAGMAVYLFGLAPNLSAAIEQCRDNLKQGRALDLLHRWQKFSALNTSKIEKKSNA